MRLSPHFYLVLLLFSHILTFNVDTGYIFEQKCMSQVFKLMCITHFEKIPGFICQNRQGGEFGSAHTAPPGTVRAEGESKLRLCVWPQLLLLLSAGLEIDPSYSFYKCRFTQMLSHLGIIVALRVYILMVKGKKKKNNNEILFWRRKALQSKRLSPMCVQVNIHI